MKRIIRWFIGPVWWASTSLRRGLMGRFDARVVRLVSWTIEKRMVPPILDALSASEARLERIEELIARADRSASTMAEEVDLVLSGLSREIFRLQTQVEMLRRDAQPAVGGLSLLSESEDAPSECSRVG